MSAALRLRLLQVHRRGGLLLLAAALVAVMLVARRAGETVDGRYGLATDVAAVLGYLGAVFLGCFPLATDRERRRATLPAASPVPPWAWALGHAAGAALLAGGATLLLFGAAGTAAAVDGGIGTNAVAPLNARGVLPVTAEGLGPIGVPPDTRGLRLVCRVVLRDDAIVGTPDLARLEVDGTRVPVVPGRPMVVPVDPPEVLLRNVTPSFSIGLVADEVRAIGEPRPFALNAWTAGLPPALGAAAVAAVGAAAGANLSAAVAALLVALLLALSSMKGFLLDSFRYGGSAAAAHDAREEPAGGHDHDHDHDHQDHDHGGAGIEPGTAVRDTARAALGAILAGLPSLSALDRTDRVAVGEWTGARGWPRAAGLLAAGLALGAALGGLGVYRRRLP